MKIATGGENERTDGKGVCIAMNVYLTKLFFERPREETEFVQVGEAKNGCLTIRWYCRNWIDCRYRPNWAIWAAVIDQLLMVAVAPVPSSPASSSLSMGTDENYTDSVRLTVAAAVDCRVQRLGIDRVLLWIDGRVIAAELRSPLDWHW